MIEQATKDRILAQMREHERSKKAERATANTLEALNLIVRSNAKLSNYIQGQTRLADVDWAAVLIHLEIARQKAQEILDGDQA